MRPVETLLFSFLVFLCILSALFHRRVPDTKSLLTLYGVLLSALFLITFLKKKMKGKKFEIIYDVLFPFLSVVLIFNSLGGLIRYINPNTYDHLFIQMDYRIFNVYPTIFFERFTSPILTEVLQVAYISYYFLPLILGIALKICETNSEHFERSMFLMILCLFLSYLGYLLFPAIGPRFTMNHLQTVELKGIFLRDIIDSALNGLEKIKRDAFPSGHTALTIVVLYLAFLYRRTLFWIFLPFVFALLIATVYLRYHYVIDVFAGVLLSIVTIYSGNKYFTWWKKLSGEAEEPPSRKMTF